MKKTAALVLVVTIILIVAACGGDGNGFSDALGQNDGRSEGGNGPGTQGLGQSDGTDLVADQTDVRSMEMAASVMAMKITPPQAPSVGGPAPGGGTFGSADDISDAILREFTGGANIAPGEYRIAFNGATAVGGMLPAAYSRTGVDVVVGLGSKDDFPQSDGPDDASGYTFITVTHR